MICGLGVMEIHSATMHTKFAGSHLRQIYWILGGVGAMFLMSAVNYQVLLDRIHWFYIAAVASLVAVLLFGQKFLGARRWIKMPGGNHFQPSEWVKLILILAMAKYFAELRHRELSWPDFIKAGAIVGIPMLMVLAQPDLGTALTYVPDRCHGSISGRPAMATGTVGRRAGDAGGGSGVLHPASTRFEVLPEAAAHQLSGAGSRSPRVGVPS